MHSPTPYSRQLSACLEIAFSSDLCDVEWVLSPAVVSVVETVHVLHPCISRTVECRCPVAVVSDLYIFAKYRLHRFFIGRLSTVYDSRYNGRSG